MSKINSLSSSQKDQIPVYRDKWLGVGLSTDPITNKPAIEEVVRNMYKNANLSAPKRFHYVASPKAAIEYISKMKGVKNKSKKDILKEMSFGNQEASWLSYYDYFINVVGVKKCEKILPIIELAQHCGWISFYDTDVIVQERPSAIRFDDQRRIHSEVGPVIEYSDGFAIYAWHGVVIPAKWIVNRKELSAKTALTWVNMEQRRSACEIVGWARILRELDATVIDSDEDLMIGTLIEVVIPELGKEKFLKVLCGTGREFAIPVPPTVMTALEANAWTFNLDGDMLRKLEVRT